jgi:hypothetical protein
MEEPYLHTGVDHYQMAFPPNLVNIDGTLDAEYFPFPMTAPQTTINAEGKLEFRFSSPERAAFFRVEGR